MNAEPEHRTGAGPDRSVDRSGVKPTEATIEQAGERRSSQVEALRAVGALAVLVGHGSAVASHSQATPEGWAGELVLGLAYGGCLLIFMSGYLLFLPFAHRYLGRGDPLRLRRYAANRALRLLPLYVVVVSVLLIVQEGGATPQKWLTFLLFAENFFPDTLGKLDPPIWTVVVELHFLLLLPLLAIMLRQLAGPSRGRAAVVLGALCVASLAVRLPLVEFEPVHDFGWHLLRDSLPANFFLLGAGMLLTLLRLSWDERTPTWVHGVLGSADAWLLAAAAGWFLMLTTSFMPLSVLPAFATVGACVLPLRPGPLLRVLSWRLFAVLGVASYSLYLWHMPIILALADLPVARSSGPGLVGLALLLSLLVTAVSYAFIEAPFLRWRRRWAPSTPQTRATRPAGLRVALRQAGGVLVAAMAIGLLLTALGADRTEIPPGGTPPTTPVATEGMQ